MAARRGEQASLHLPIASRAMPIPGRADLPIASRASLHLSGKNKSIIGLNRKIDAKLDWLSSKYLFFYFHPPGYSVAIQARKSVLEKSSYS